MRYPKIVGRSKYTKAVEFVDGGVLRRCLIPRDIKATAAECERGILVGVHMEDIKRLLESDLDGLAERLEHEIHRRGLYGSADVERNPEPGKLVSAAVSAAVKPLVPHLVELLRQEV